MRVFEALKQSKEKLESKGVSNGGLDSRILLAHALLVSKDWVIFNPDFTLNQKQKEVFFELVNRRANREPISHLTNKREFFGEDFLVNKDVLDPRPDSEILIETALKYLAKNFAPSNSNSQQMPSDNPTNPTERKIKILELGVGSGCLIITLLKAFRNATGTAVDISQPAIKIAQKNSENHQVFSRLNILKSDLFSNLNRAEKFDLIISNPPYIPAAEIEMLAPEVRIYEPRAALDGGIDGLDFYRRIAAEAKNFLNDCGAIFVEIGYGQEKLVSEIFVKNGFSYLSSSLDLSGVTRVLQFK